MAIRVLVVDDSAFMRKLLTEMIKGFPGFEVAGTAKNGAEAVQQVVAIGPDVVTMDVEMPVMDGLKALAEVMRVRPTPVIMVSSLTQEGADATVQALMLGAVDFIAKPSGSISTELISKQKELRMMLQAASSSHPSVQKWGNDAPKAPATAQAGRQVRIPSPPPSVEIKPHQQRISGICAIGTSTGGPKALEKVITALPGDFGVPVVVVQHMPVRFTASLAQRLDQHSNLRVVEAGHHQILESGYVYIAPGGKHLEVESIGAGKYRTVIHEQNAVNGHRPSVEVMFDSITQLRGLKKAYVIMTGMGADGAYAMKRAKEAALQSVTIAESEATCVVYGMPKAAVELKCIDHLLPLTQIADKLIGIFHSIARV
ncbi:chemotaxis response regulator protein-glutamate methylesterase [Paenibacillus sp. sgz5001063]|uniref:protein-glutamate methylesterase/protein-glutamine glutaminase n=1 Tax=Paenibacillus sp. sgz5001063 TaxID=3242474 RepID=UPI0036D24880